MLVDHRPDLRWVAPKVMTKAAFGYIEISHKRVHMEFTNVCEFDCVFCPKSMMTWRPVRRDTGLARQIMTELRDEGICCDAK